MIALCLQWLLAAAARRILRSPEPHDATTYRLAIEVYDLSTASLLAHVTEQSERLDGYADAIDCSPEMDAWYADPFGDPPQASQDHEPPNWWANDPWGES